MRNYTSSYLIFPIQFQFFNDQEIQNQFVITKYSRMITLTSCGENDFTCGNGDCVEMEQRCDRSSNCLDETDEKNCSQMKTFEGYSKLFVPKPIKNQTKFQLNVSLSFEKIVSIDEFEGKFRAKMIITRMWFNPDLQYFNLKKDPNQNQLSEEEKDMIWIPWTVFHNVEHEKDVLRTDQVPTVKIVPNADFEFKMSENTHFEKARIFDGSTNFLNYTIEYLVNLICDFDMAWYPFDQQVCTLKLYHSEDSLMVNPVELQYVGPKVLPQHFVIKTVYCSKIVNGKPGAIAEIHLGRPLFGSIITIYIPTSTFVVLCQLVGVFKDEYLDMVIGVNITLLLVFATL